MYILASGNKDVHTCLKKERCTDLLWKDVLSSENKDVLASQKNFTCLSKELLPLKMKGTKVLTLGAGR